MTWRTAAGKVQTRLNAWEALSEGIQPWYNVAIAFVGAAGILVGGRLGKRSAMPSIGQ